MKAAAVVFTKYHPLISHPAVTIFSFDYGPAHFVCIDQYNAGGYTSGTTQYNWLVNDLSTSTKPWKFIVLHEPGWSAYGADAQPNNTTVQSVIQPLAVQYNVPIIFAGHNHFYSRCRNNGVNHVVNGGGGSPFHSIDTSKPYVITATANTLEFCKVSITGNTLTVNTTSSTGSTIDSFTVTR